MVDELIDIIPRIVQYGLTTDVKETNKLLSLEKSLISLYAFILNTPDARDESTYIEAPKTNVALRANIAANFPSFGYYKYSLDMFDVYNMDDMAIGDAVDDLHDIIDTLLEVQWRMKNTNYENALWHLQFLFRSHLKSRLLGLLRYTHENATDI